MFSIKIAAIAAAILAVGGALGMCTALFDTAPYVRLKALLPRDLPSEPNYKGRLNLFEALRDQRYDVAMLGDSLVELGPWNELFPDVKIANRGISGDLAELVAKRLDTVKSTGARKVLLMFGVNNLRHGSDIDATFASYRRVIDGLAPMSVVVQSTVLTSNDAANGRIAELNKRLYQYCSTGACSYLDISRVIAPAGRLTPELSADGTHLLGEGYLRWQKAISATVRDPKLLSAHAPDAK
jgi:lysophospholipase L1-like esterase